MCVHVTRAQLYAMCVHVPALGLKFQVMFKIPQNSYRYIVRQKVVALLQSVFFYALFELHTCW